VEVDLGELGVLVEQPVHERPLAGQDLALVSDPAL
jgi:hypothetical protein